MRFRITDGFSCTTLMEHLDVPGSEQVEQHSKVRIPPHWPKEVMWFRRHVLMAFSLIGQITAIQLELNLRLTIPSSIVRGSVIFPENNSPAKINCII